MFNWCPTINLLQLTSMCINHNESKLTGRFYQPKSVPSIYERKIKPRISSHLSLPQSVSKKHLSYLKFH